MVLGAPAGKFIYARGDLLEPARLLEYLHAGKYTGAMVTPNILRRAGGALKGLPVWLYSTPDGDGDSSTPDSWLPSQYARTIAAFEALALEHGIRGYLADAESGWASATQQQSEAFARALVDSRKRTGLSVGMTTFPTHPLWRRVGHIAGGDVWLSLQMYAQRSLAENKRILADVGTNGWGTHVPSLAAYMHPGPGQTRARTAAEWDAAYGPSSWPGTLRGGIIWYALPAPRGGLEAAIAAWRRYITLPFLLTIAGLAAAAAAGVALCIAWATEAEA